MGDVVEMRCAMTLCPYQRCRSPYSRLCLQHITLEVLKVMRGKGDYMTSSLDVHLALEGARGAAPSALRKVIRTVIKHEDKIIDRANN